ncbi:hypothetical protein L218DRAFT_861115, partial [Marasmius fiardii PR-910]
PATTNDFIFSCLDPHDIIYYSQTCREAYRQVQSYWRRAMRIEDLLSSYFTRSETCQFRVIQSLTGALISGSTALQLLNRERYPDSDLDIYVEHRYGSFIGSFLEVIGYKFKPTQEQPKDLEVAIKKVAREMRKQRGYQGYSQGRGFAGVFNLVRGGRNIQLITAAESPLDIILNFHSTVVMNVVSYSYVYSLYPRATFREALSLRTYCNEGAERELARQKYVNRGWKMLNSDGSEWKLNRSSLSGNATRCSSRWIDKLRRLGDSFCWVFKLPIPDFPTEQGSSDDPVHRWLMSRRCDLPTPLVMEELRSGKQALEGNSWVLSRQDYDEEDDDDRRILSGSVQTRLTTRNGHRAFQKYDTYRMLYDVLGNTQLRHTYCVALESEDWAPQVELIQRVRRSGVYQGVVGSSNDGNYGFTAPLNFRAKRYVCISNVKPPANYLTFSQQ